MNPSTMLAIFDSRPPSSRKEGRHQGHIHWLVWTKVTLDGTSFSFSFLIPADRDTRPNRRPWFTYPTNSAGTILCGKGSSVAKRKGGICSSGKNLPAQKVRVSGREPRKKEVRCQVVVSAEENHSCPVYWAAPGGPGFLAQARDCFVCHAYVLIASGH